MNLKLVSIFACASLCAVVSAKEVPWAKSFSAAKATAIGYHRLVMVDFYTDWCGWCKKLDTTTYEDNAFAQAAEQVVPVKVNAEKEGITEARKYGVKVYPTILFIDPSNGKVVSTISGYLPTGPFLTEIDVANTIYRSLPALQAKVKQHPDDAEALERLALVYAKQDKLDESSDLLSKAEKLDPKGTMGPLGTAYSALGGAYAAKNKADDAGRYYAKTLEISTDSYQRADADLSLASINMQAGNKDKALAEIQEVISDPKAPDYIVEIAKSMAKQLK